MVTLLGWATLLFSIATINTVCLQALYTSPAFCQVISDKLHQVEELRTKFEPWPSWDFLRYILAYGTVGTVYFALALHLAAFALIIESARNYVPAIVFRISITMIPFVSLVVWGISNVMETLRERASTRMEENAPAASTVRQNEKHAITPDGV